MTNLCHDSNHIPTKNTGETTTGVVLLPSPLKDQVGEGKGNQFGRLLLHRGRRPISGERESRPIWLPSPAKEKAAKLVALPFTGGDASPSLVKATHLVNL